MTVRQDVLSVDMNSLRHLPIRSSNNFNLQFANIDRLMENYSIDDYVTHSVTCNICTASCCFKYKSHARSFKIIM